MSPDQASRYAALLLIHRLVERHDLTPEEATTAVAQRRRREAGPHTHLVVAEARLVVEESSAPIRAFMTALLPMVKAMREAMAELATALQQLAPTAPTAAMARRDRPAWATPYGPPPRRR